jgi:predicted porin
MELSLKLPMLMAIVAAVPTASAQGVSLYGIADVAVEYGRYNQGVSQMRVTSGQLSPSRLGFRGSEQIDGDLKANYGMEIGVSLDNGAGGMGNSLFSRGSYVGLENSAVRVDLGRMFVPVFWVYLNSDPSAVPAAAGGSMAALQHAATLGRSGSAGFFDNGVRLRFKPAFGVDAEMFYSHGNELGGARAHDGRTVGANMMMRREQWWMGYGYNRYTTRAATDLFDVSQTTHIAGATYDLGWVKVGGNYLNSKKLSANGRDVASWILSAKVPAGPGSINVGTGRLTETGGRAAQAVHAGYVLPLSKRSMLYAYYSHIRNNALGTRGLALINQQQGTVAAGFDPSVLITGMRHDF